MLGPFSYHGILQAEGYVPDGWGPVTEDDYDALTWAEIAAKRRYTPLDWPDVACVSGPYEEGERAWNWAPLDVMLSRVREWLVQAGPHLRPEDEAFLMEFIAIVDETRAPRWWLLLRTACQTLINEIEVRNRKAA